MKKETLSFRIDPGIKEELRKNAKAQKMILSKLCRKMIYQSFEENEVNHNKTNSL